MDLIDKRDEILRLFLEYGIRDNIENDLRKTDLADCAEEIVKLLSIPDVVHAKPEKVCELIRQKFDDWIFGLETQAGEKLKVVDSADFNEIITEIESELENL